jgi:hypothetical protein
VSLASLCRKVVYRQLRLQADVVDRNYGQGIAARVRSGRKHCVGFDVTQEARWRIGVKAKHGKCSMSALVGSWLRQEYFGEVYRDGRTVRQRGKRWGPRQDSAHYQHYDAKQDWDQERLDFRRYVDQCSQNIVNEQFCRAGRWQDERKLWKPAPGTLWYKIYFEEKEQVAA